MSDSDQIRSLINRLARLDSSAIWADELNPAQIAALGYLARANRFSRSPSHVASYLGTTRGTMSQTLRSLARKGYLTETRSETDKRAISCRLTEAGQAAAARGGALDPAIDGLEPTARAQLLSGLMAVLRQQVARNGGRGFGICQSCAHHRTTADGPYCALLSQPLLPEEAQQICHEQVPA